MFILDTNVISELRKVLVGKGADIVGQWAQRADAGLFYLSAITVMELEQGTLLIERRDPRQAAPLRRWINEHVLRDFAGRILPIDTAVARRCAELHVPNSRADRDALIAATALVHGMTVVTRDVRDFQGTGVAILNPWQAA